MVHREIKEYPDLPQQQLYLSLSWVVFDLCHVLDQIGFLRSQELEAKKTAWLATPELSTQARGQHANYAASTITAELVQREAERDRLNAERNLIERLLDAST